MPYFFIVPAYALLLLVLAITAIVMYSSPQTRPAAGYIVGGTIGSLVGFLVSIVVLAVVCVVFILLAGLLSSSGQWVQTASAVGLAGVIFVGPFILSAAGILAGFACGALFVLRRRMKRVKSS
jgi:hypothetical protein